jgi:hypothetical protein
MGYTTSTVHGIEVPDSAEANNVPEDIGKVVTALEGGSIVKRLTGAQIAALTSPQKPAGLLVYNTTTNKVQISNGTSFANYDAAVYAQGTTTTLTSAYVAAKVTYTSEVDPSSMLSSGTFTLPTAGVWMVSSRATTSAAVLYSIEIRHSGTTIGGNTVSGNEEVESAQLVVASASDTIEVWVSGNGGTTAVRTVVARIGT